MIAPNINPGAALGTGGAASVVGSDLAGVIAVTTGATPPVGGGNLFTGFLPVGLYVGYTLTFQPLDDTTALLRVGGSGNSLFTSVTLPAGGTVYRWSYRAQFQGAGAALA